jgi:hypothetical protein
MQMFDPNTCLIWGCAVEAKGVARVQRREQRRRRLVHIGAQDILHQPHQDAVFQYRASTRKPGEGFRKQQVVGSSPTTGSSIRKGYNALPVFFCDGILQAL